MVLRLCKLTILSQKSKYLKNEKFYWLVHFAVKCEHNDVAREFKINI